MSPPELTEVVPVMRDVLGVLDQQIAALAGLREDLASLVEVLDSMTRSGPEA